MAKRVLGKGLSALIGNSVAPVVAPRLEPAAPAWLGDRQATMLSLEALRPNPHQPRHQMDETALEELSDSIRQNGVLQPILVRRTAEGFELVAGERRLRAAARAGLGEIPALVCSMEETESMKLALLENIQREDLSALEEAEAYRAIMQALDASHQELATMLGKSRSTVSNMLRLLQLEPPIHELMEAGLLTMGHARALLSVEDSRARVRLARHTAQKGLSVRALEREARRLISLSSTASSRRRRRGRRDEPQNAAVRALEERLRHHLGTAARIHRRGEKGRLEIPFFSDAELEGILERMGVETQL
jgi:ParB family chromosome partitioning protein